MLKNVFLAHKIHIIKKYVITTQNKARLEALACSTLNLQI